MTDFSKCIDSKPYSQGPQKLNKIETVVISPDEGLYAQDGIDAVAAADPATETGIASQVSSYKVQAGRDEVALAATPPVATGGDAATMRG